MSHLNVLSGIIWQDYYKGGGFQQGRCVICVNVGGVGELVTGADGFVDFNEWLNEYS